MPLLGCSQLSRTSPPRTQTSQQTLPQLREEDAGGRQGGWRTRDLGRERRTPGQGSTTQNVLPGDSTRGNLGGRGLSCLQPRALGPGCPTARARCFPLPKQPSPPVRTCCRVGSGGLGQGQSLRLPLGIAGLGLVPAAVQGLGSLEAARVPGNVSLGLRRRRLGCGAVAFLRLARCWERQTQAVRLRGRGQRGLLAPHPGTYCRNPGGAQQP